MSAVIAALVTTIQARDDIVLRALELTLGETVAAHTLHLGQESLVTLHQLAVLCHHLTNSCLQCGADTEATCGAEASVNEGSIGLA